MVEPPNRGQAPLDLSEMLDQPLQENQLWLDFADAVSRVFDLHVTRPRRRLQQIRRPDRYKRGDVVEMLDGRMGVVSRIIMRSPTTDEPDRSDIIEIYASDTDQLVEVEADAMIERDLLRANASLLGFDFVSSNLKNEDYYRIVKYVGMYWPEGGTENFVNFLAYVKNMRLKIRRLWSQNTYENDFRLFVPQEETGTPVSETDENGERGTWYPTSHVDLVYEAEKYTTDIQDIVKLFYILAPYHLVLYRLYSLIVGTTDYVSDNGTVFPHGINVGGAGGVSSLDPGQSINLDERGRGSHFIAAQGTDRADWGSREQKKNAGTDRTLVFGPAAPARGTEFGGAPVINQRETTGNNTLVFGCSGLGRSLEFGASLSGLGTGVTPRRRTAAGKYTTAYAGRVAQGEIEDETLGT